MSEATEWTKNDVHTGELDDVMEDDTEEGHKIAGNKAPLLHARARVNKDKIFGVRVSWEEKREHTTLTQKDLKMLMKLIANVDPGVPF